MRHRHHTRRIKCNLVGVARSRLLYIGILFFSYFYTLSYCPRRIKISSRSATNSRRLKTAKTVRHFPWSCVRCVGLSTFPVSAQKTKRETKRDNRLSHQREGKEGEKKGSKRIANCVLLSNRICTYFIRERLVRPVARAHGAAYRAAQCGAGEDALHAPALGHSFDHHRWGCSCVGAFCVSI